MHRTGRYTLPDANTAGLARGPSSSTLPATSITHAVVVVVRFLCCVLRLTCCAGGRRRQSLSDWGTLTADCRPLWLPAIPRPLSGYSIDTTVHLCPPSSTRTSLPLLSTSSRLLCSLSPPLPPIMSLLIFLVLLLQAWLCLSTSPSTADIDRALSQSAPVTPPAALDLHTQRWLRNNIAPVGDVTPGMVRLSRPLSTCRAATVGPAVADVALLLCCLRCLCCLCYPAEPLQLHAT